VRALYASDPSWIWARRTSTAKEFAQKLEDLAAVVDPDETALTLDPEAPGPAD
jgi:hypothetical protein